MKNQYLYIAIIFLSVFACGKKTDSSSDIAWMKKEHLTIDEIIDKVTIEVEQAKSFKYTSTNSANINFYGGQKTNTFLLDKKGNAFSSRDREQNFKIDGKMYRRKTGLMEEGLVATVISDILDKSTLDKDYFERNIPYVKNNGIINVKMLKKCHITTSVSGNTLTIKTKDFDKIDNADKEFLTDVTAIYTPQKDYTIRATIEKDGKEITATYVFTFNPDEKVKLPKLLKIGEKLSPVD